MKKTSLEALEPSSSRGGAKLLLITSLLIIVIWQLPFGNTILYPFTLLSIWFHEMGHGLAAMMMGYEFRKILLRTDMAYAIYGYFEERDDSGNLTMQYFLKRAFVSFAGPIGPCFVGCLLLIFSVKPPVVSRIMLFGLGSSLIFSTFMWIRGSWLGYFFVPAVGLLFILLALKLPNTMVRFFTQFIGSHAIISLFRNARALFYVHVANYEKNSVEASDTQTLQDFLSLPVNFWASFLCFFAFCMLLFSLRYIYVYETYTSGYSNTKFSSSNLGFKNAPSNKFIGFGSELHGSSSHSSPSLSKLVDFLDLSLHADKTEAGSFVV